MLQIVNERKGRQSTYKGPVTSAYNGTCSDFVMAFRIESVVERIITTIPKPAQDQAANRCKRVLRLRGTPDVGVVSIR